MKEFRISEEAVAALRALKEASPEAKPDHAIRVYMMMGFCGGPQWGFMLGEYDENTDECCEFDGLKFIVESDLLEAMGGLDISIVPSDEDGEDCFMVIPLDPDAQAFFEQQSHGCGGCGGCHGGCGGCHGGCSCHDEDGEDGCGCGCGHCHSVEDGCCCCEDEEEGGCGCGCCHCHDDENA